MLCSFLTGLFLLLVRFIVRYIIFHVAIGNGNFFWIFLSDISLLVYKNVFSFWMLTLLPTILPKSLIRSYSFFHGVYLCTQSWHLQTVTTLLLAFQFGMPFVSFSCVTIVSRCFNNVLDRSFESGHPWLGSDLRGKDFSFCPLSMMLAVGFSYMSFIMFKSAPSTPTFWVFLS